MKMELENDYGCTMNGDYSDEELEKLKKVGLRERK